MHFKTLTDHVFFSTFPDTCNKTAADVLEYLMSNHYPASISNRVNKSCSNGPVHEYITHRSLKLRVKQTFLFDLSPKPLLICTFHY